jgi:hypothetical protein
VGEDSNVFVRKNKELNDARNCFTISEGCLTVPNIEERDSMNTYRKNVKEGVFYGNFGLLKHQYITNEKSRGSELRMLTMDK